MYTLFEDPTVARTDPDLARKVRSAVELCEQVIRDVGQQHCALSFNGGKDCTVLVHILSAVLRRLNGNQGLPRIAALYITCPSPFAAVERFIDFCVSPMHGYNLDIISVSGGMKRGIATYLDGGGERRSASTTTTSSGEGGRPREIKAMFVGTRRDDPHGPQLAPRSWTDNDWPRVERIHPILDWTYADVWRFLRSPHLASTDTALGIPRDQLAKAWGTTGGGSLGVPYCVLYDQGYTSLGSTFNTLPNPELRINTGEEEERGEGRWKPAYMLQDGSLERAGRVENAQQAKGLQT